MNVTVKRRAGARLVRFLLVGLLAVAGVQAGTGTAAAAEVTWTDPSGFRLYTRTSDDTTAWVEQNRLPKVGLASLAGTGTAVQTGLCYPAPFNPGVDATGYCWGNTTDDAGSGDGWYPQGIAVPHGESVDGTWGGRRWEVVSWHRGSDDNLARLRFVDRGSYPPRWTDVLVMEADQYGTLTPIRGLHSDGVVWYRNSLLIADGRQLVALRLGDLRMDAAKPYGFDHVLPVTRHYWTVDNPAASTDTCATRTGNQPCLNALSYDQTNGVLLSAEYTKDTGGGRLVHWPFDESTGLPEHNVTTEGTAHTKAQGAWTTPVYSVQGATYAQGSFFVSGRCPDSFDTGYRESACVHKAAPGEAPHVLTAVPDMSQNLDWDSSQGRVHGVSEVIQTSAQQYPQRLVYEFEPTARAITTVRFKNLNSGKCLLPYGASLNDGANVVQWTCNGTSAQNWYWNGSQIRNFQSDRCLTPYGGSATKGANVVQWACNGSAGQNWYRAAGAGGGSLLVNSANGLCLTLYGGSTSDDAVTVQWTCDAGSLAHSWTGSGL